MDAGAESQAGTRSHGTTRRQPLMPWDGEPYESVPGTPLPARTAAGDGIPGREIGPGSGPKTQSQKTPGNGPGDGRFPRRGGTVQYPPFPSTTDVGFVTGGLHKHGRGGLPRRAVALLANLFGLTFLDSGALPVCVYRFSGVSIRLGAWGVVVKGIEYDSLISNVDLVTGAFSCPSPVSSCLGPTPLGLYPAASGSTHFGSSWHGVRRGWGQAS